MNRWFVQNDVPRRCANLHGMALRVSNFFISYPIDVTWHAVLSKSKHFLRRSSESSNSHSRIRLIAFGENLVCWWFQHWKARLGMGLNCHWGCQWPRALRTSASGIGRACIVVCTLQQWKFLWCDQNRNPPSYPFKTMCDIRLAHVQTVAKFGLYHRMYAMINRQGSDI